MAASRKHYKLVRPSDQAEFTMLLSEEDAQKYKDAKWDVTQKNGGATVTAKDLAAPGMKAKPAKS